MFFQHLKIMVTLLLKRLRFHDRDDFIINLA